MKNLRSKIKSVRNFKEQGKVVLVRADYNVEFIDGKIVDDTRIISTLPTLQHLTDLKSKLVLISHFGRPKGKFDPKLSLSGVASYLADALGRKFVSCDDFTFPEYPSPHIIFCKGDVRKLERAHLDKLNPGDILFLENIRFYPEEESLDENFAKHLASLVDVYVNEAFSVNHHGSVSISLIPKFVQSFAGLRLVQEMEVLDHVSLNANNPFVILAGGAKITEKAAMFNELLPRADYVLVGGAMANLFLKAQGFEIGDSKMEAEGVSVVNELWRNFREKIVLPRDVVVAFKNGSSGEVKPINGVRPGERILDIGPQTILEFAGILKTANTIIWNGPMGVFEQNPFSHGTLALARLVGTRGKGRAYVLVGGGETLQALNISGVKEYVDFVSTGGGAMLSYLGGEKLPGIEALVE